MTCSVYAAWEHREQWAESNLFPKAAVKLLKQPPGFSVRSLSTVHSALVTVKVQTCEGAKRLGFFSCPSSLVLRYSCARWAMLEAGVLTLESKIFL